MLAVLPTFTTHVSSLDTSSPMPTPSVSPRIFVPDVLEPGSTPTRARARPKGEQTRAAILEAAVRLAARKGLEGLSIGALADVAHMSKSGVFAHFGSREELQISVIREYHAKFEEEVFRPAMYTARGLPRLRALFERWVQRVSVEIDSGCIYISGAVEFDDRPGPVRDALAGMVETWRAAMSRAIEMSIEERHLRPDTDAAQMLFEIHGLILALHHDARFLRQPGAVERALASFERIASYYRAPTAIVTSDVDMRATAPTSSNTSGKKSTPPRSD